MSFKPRNFREWCNYTLPVLPQVYGDELSYYELLNKVVEKLNAMGITVNELIEYVNNYFSDESFQKYVDNKLDEMVKTGYFDTIIKHYFDRKMIFIGDSYILGYSNDGKIYTSFADVIKANSNYDITVLGASGAGFANAGTLPSEMKNFLALLQSYAGSQDEKNSITDIYVFGGFNDRTHTVTEIYEEMTNFSNYSKNNFPNALIHVAFISWSTNSDEYEALARTCMAYSQCGIRGMSYIKNSQYILHNTVYFTSDGIHPNNEGHAKLASYLLSSINGNEIDVIEQKGMIDFPAKHGMQITNAFTSLQNEIVTLEITETNTLNLSVIYSGADWSKTLVAITGDVVITPLVGYTSSVWSGSCLCKINNAYITVPCTIRMTKRALYLILFPVINGIQYKGVITECILPRFNIVSPSLLS